jgi:hypothetical protein
MIKFLALALVGALGACAGGFGAMACSTSSSGHGAGSGASSCTSDAGILYDAEGEPYLTDLCVSSGVDGASPVTLVPDYSPRIHDYYVNCAAGENALTVSMTAASGSSSLLVQPTASPALPTQTLSVNVLENEAIVAVAKNGNSKTEYWVRCLPPDFLSMKGTVHADVGTAPPGYYLIGSLITPAGFAGYAMIVDQNGVPVWYARQPNGGRPVMDVDVVVSGLVSFSFLPTFTDSMPSPNQPFIFVKPGSSTATTLPPTRSSLLIDDHDLQVTPSGSYVAFYFPVKTGVDLTGLTTVDGGVLGKNSTILDCHLVEFDSNGNLLSSPWVATEHFDPAQDTEYVDLQIPALDGGVVYDVFHCNSVDVDPANGNYLISSRQMDSIFYVEKGTGKVLWKMGGKRASLDNAVYVSVPSPFYRQHDARLQAGWMSDRFGGAGRVSLFDDETGVLLATDGGASPAARGVVYDVIVGAGDCGTESASPEDVVTPDGGTVGAATLALEYKAPASSLLGGSVRFYADGSRVVGWGTMTVGPVYTILSEFDADGHDLLDLEFVALGGSYRAIKVPLGAFDLTTLRNSAGSAIP